MRKQVYKSIADKYRKLSHYVRRWCPKERARCNRIAVHRANALASIQGLARHGTDRWSGKVLVDATWYNANYWFRYGLLRAALGIQPSDEIGFLGRYNKKIARKCLQNLSVGEIRTLGSSQNDKFLREAKAYLTLTLKPQDIFGWKLPYNFPAEQIYDGMLNFQRKAQVDLGDRNLAGYLARALQAITEAANLLDQTRPSLVVLSHAINLELAPIAWLAAQRKIPTIIAFGNFGVLRFWRIVYPDDIFDWWDRLTQEEFEAIPVAKAQALERTGASHIERRLTGQTNDLGAAYAFSRTGNTLDRTEMVNAFGWSAQKPLIVIYAPNWFDYPHTFGMTNFIDFQDWLECTLLAATENTHVNWLIRAHPCDAWYGGESVQSILKSSLPSHIQVCPDDWNGRAVMDGSDAMVTCHSTGGVEFASQGKPVLVSDRGWYHSYGFVIRASSREHYTDLLKKEWWKDIDGSETARRARVFSGLAFGAPSWQSGFLTADDSEQEANWGRNSELLEKHGPAANKEIETLREWYFSGQRFYHFYKMLRAEAFQTSNVTDGKHGIFSVNSIAFDQREIPTGRT